MALVDFNNSSVVTKLLNFRQDKIRDMSTKERVRKINAQTFEFC